MWIYERFEVFNLFLIHSLKQSCDFVWGPQFLILSKFCFILCCTFLMCTLSYSCIFVCHCNYSQQIIWCFCFWNGVGIISVLLEVDAPSGELGLSTWMITLDEPIFESHHAEDLIFHQHLVGSNTWTHILVIGVVNEKNVNWNGRSYTISTTFCIWLLIPFNLVTLFNYWSLTLPLVFLWIFFLCGPFHKSNKWHLTIIVLKMMPMG